MALNFCENGDYSCMHYDDIEADDDEIQKCTECDGYKALEEPNASDIIMSLRATIKHKDEELKELKEAHVDEHQLVVELQQEIKELQQENKELQESEWDLVTELDHARDNARWTLPGWHLNSKGKDWTLEEEDWVMSDDKKYWVNKVTGKKRKIKPLKSETYSK